MDLECVTSFGGLEHVIFLEDLVLEYIQFSVEELCEICNTLHLL